MSAANSRSRESASCSKDTPGTSSANIKTCPGDNMGEPVADTATSAAARANSAMARVSRVIRHVSASNPVSPAAMWVISWARIARNSRTGNRVNASSDNPMAA